MEEEFRSSKYSIDSIENETKKISLNDKDFTLKYLKMANNSDLKV